MAHAEGDDPFKDPSLDSHGADGASTPQAHQNVPDTLAVGRNASLTLGTDSLVVLGMASYNVSTHLC
jgi:sphingosine kinase